MLEKGIHIRDTLFPYDITDKLKSELKSPSFRYVNAISKFPRIYLWNYMSY